MPHPPVQVAAVAEVAVAVADMPYLAEAEAAADMPYLAEAVAVAAGDRPSPADDRQTLGP